MTLCLKFLCIQKLLLHEREKREQAEAARRKLLEKCRFLFNQLQECNVGLPYECEDRTVINSSSLSDAFNQLTTSDDQVDILLSEVSHISVYVLATTHLETLVSSKLSNC